ncbi:MAG: efflux RND transporter periplasmic adaptor subunit [Anaerolineae bacterium]|nr:efflux RND transporter periplasmic adaptor subunit [Anaerolineae bacterium]
MSVRRSLLLLALLMFALPILAFSVNQRIALEQTAPTLDLSTLQTQVIGRGRVESVVSAIGAIEAEQTVSLSFLVPGRVAEVFVKQGDYIFAGEPLIRLDNAAEQLAYQQAQLGVDSAQLNFNDITSPVSEEDLRIAQANVDSAWGQYLSISNAVTDEDIRAAELRYQQAFSAYEALREARDQAPGGFGSPTYNTLDAQTGAASFNAEIARLQLESLRTGNAPQANAAYARVIQAQREFERVQAGPTQFQIDAAALGVRRADGTLRRAETALNRTTLTAPFDGIVTAVNVEVGALLIPGFAVIEMSDISPLRLTVQVDEVDIRLVNRQQPARVELDALPDVEIPALVQGIALVGTTTNGIVSYGVDLTLNAGDSRVRVGMTAEANIIIEERLDVLVIPNFYVRLDREQDKAFVEVLRADQTIEEIEITLGLQGLEVSEVIAGLAEGDIVVLDPNSDRFPFLEG